MKSIIEFLSELAKNNNREWFEKNKERYRVIKQRMDAFAERFVAVIERFDPNIEGLKAKDVTYRIYRDTRFSKDKTPYKTWFGVFVSPRGKKSGFAGYYVHLEPARNLYMLCSGAYCPSAGEQRSVREEFMTEGKAFVEAIEAAQGFDLVWDGAYKRVPNGWSAEDEFSQYYRLRAYLVERLVDESYFTADDFFDRVADDFSRTKPFNDTLNRAIEYAREMGW